MRENRQSNCPDERDIARYLARTIPVEQRQLMEKHFAYCSRCNSALADLMRLAPKKNEEVPPVSLPEAWSRIETELDGKGSDSKIRDAGAPADGEPRASETTAVSSSSQLGSAKIIELQPRLRIREVDLTEYALAADSKVAKTPGDVTYTSKDGSILGKFLRNERTGELCLFLVSENMDRVRGAFVSAYNPVLAYRVEGLVDPEGVFFLGKAPPLNPEETRIEICLPEASFELKPREWRHSLLDEGNIELDSPEGYALRVEIIEQGTRRKYRLDFSDLRAAHPGCTLRVFVSQEKHSSEVEIGPEGVGWLQKEEPEDKRVTIRAYVVKCAG